MLELRLSCNIKNLEHAWGKNVSNALITITLPPTPFWDLVGPIKSHASVPVLGCGVQCSGVEPVGRARVAAALQQELNRTRPTRRARQVQRRQPRVVFQLQQATLRVVHLFLPNKPLEMTALFCYFYDLIRSFSKFVFLRTPNRTSLFFEFQAPQSEKKI